MHDPPNSAEQSHSGTLSKAAPSCMALASARTIVSHRWQKNEGCNDSAGGGPPFGTGDHMPLHSHATTSPRAGYTLSSPLEQSSPREHAGADFFTSDKST